MKRLFSKTGALMSGLILSSGLLLSAQSVILQERFGNDAWTGDPAAYPAYSSDALFSGDAPHDFPASNSSGYPAASGGGTVLMGSWNGPYNTEFVMQCNTEGYTGVRLSFGIFHQSQGWGVCQLTNNFTRIEYSTDSAGWSVFDNAYLVNASYWPCADDQLWAFVEPGQVLPSVPQLFIRFTHTSPDIHPFYLDDITISGFLPDDTPPTAPSNLYAEKIGIDCFILGWDAARDESGIGVYRVFQDGNYLLSTLDSMVWIEHQMAGSTAEYSVYAVDRGENISAESPRLEVTLLNRPVDFTYSWEQSHVKFLPGGDMEWQPEEFAFTPGPSVRYIDYEEGNDANDGLTKLTPWKHHPWDAGATGNALSCTGIHTYVFKRGVVYRGVLTARSSGTLLEPIRLTSDPSWGSGEACFYGSRRLTGGWTRAGASVAPHIPEPEKVWYMDIDLPETKMVCELEGDQIRPLHVARSPNYRHTPDDPLRTWWTMTAKTAADGGLWLTDRVNLVQTDPAFYQGATIFSQEDAIVMCTVWKQDVDTWDPANHRVKVPNTSFGGVGSHYYIENTPFLLDTLDEFYYDMGAHRLFVRLSGERDPNTTILEVADKTKLIDITNQHDIGISGLTFGFTTAHTVRYGEEDMASTIRMNGICHHIDIHSNRFYYMNGGISLNNTGSSEVNTHAITVSDNDLQHIGDLSIVFSTNQTYMDDIHILRNKLYHCGYRHQGRSYSSIPAIYAQLNYGEIAGNIIEESWGNGIDAFWGKGGSSDLYVPFIRGLIYQNKASNTLIGTNDYGGIESWQGGPVYCFNNYSHNASGYKHYNNSSIGYAYYFDGSFKHVVFNNIASGVSHNRNAAAIMQVLGYYNLFVNNTAYNTSNFFHAWKDELGLNGHNAYLANLSEDVTWFFRHEINPDYIPFESFGNNVAAGSPFIGTLENRDANLSLEQFSGRLEDYRSQLTQTGWNQSGDAIPLAGQKDFRPLENSQAIDHGVRFFTAFPLSRVVGEWNFYRHPADSTLIMGDNFYMTGDFNERTTYQYIPKNHLTTHHVSDPGFVMGALEDWTRGALKFDGDSVFCHVGHAEASAVKSNNVDMTGNDFIIEVYFQSDSGHTGGIIVSKQDGAAGYELGMDDQGFAVLALYASGSLAVELKSDEKVNDGSWHHLLAEVVRHRGINLFLDGKRSNGMQNGAMPDPSVSLSNGADLMVGRGPAGQYFKGMLDFLRLSKGSLADARTTIDELYAWQSDGPFLYDMVGNPPEGKRDVGALETFTGCTLSLSEDSLRFEAGSSSKVLTVEASGGYSTGVQSGSFFSLELRGDSIEVSVLENTFPESRTGSFSVAGCGHVLQVTVSQEGAPCMFRLETDTLSLTGQAQSVAVPVSTNGTVNVQPDQDFVQAELPAGLDTIWMYVSENGSGSARQAEVKVEGCHGSSVIALFQEAVITGLDQPGAADIMIYPNPVTGSKLQIVLPEGSGTYDYTITDLSGRAIRNGRIYPHQRSIPAGLEKGSYILRLVGDHSQYQTTIIVM
ncbi:MAG: LamG-like jellyroll fold domain-containing protein [Bacteroidota bacterium]